MNSLNLYYGANWCYRHKIPLLPALLQATLYLLFKAVVPYKCAIGKNSKLAHGGTGVVIHPDVIVGENVFIGQLVTIGGRGKWGRVPEIGSDVYIGAGAKILGPLRIGNGTVIGANAVVYTNIPPRCVAAGIPARVLRRDVNVRDVEQW